MATHSKLTCESWIAEHRYQAQQMNIPAPEPQRVLTMLVSPG
jgi:hypothetical protein